MTNRLWAAALAAALMATAVTAVHAEIIEQIIVKVNGEIITKTEFEQRQVLALRARKVDVDPQSPELKKAIAEITPQLIVDAVDELILLQRGKDLGYKLSDEQFAQVVSQIRKDNKLDTDEAFNAALKQEGMRCSASFAAVRTHHSRSAKSGATSGASSGSSAAANARAACARTYHTGSASMPRAASTPSATFIRVRLATAARRTSGA